VLHQQNFKLSKNYNLFLKIIKSAFITNYPTIYILRLDFLSQLPKAHLEFWS
jgi:hypothetical protein